MKIPYISIITGVGLFLLGGAVGGFLVYSRATAIKPAQYRPVREANSSYRYIHPLLGYEVPQIEQDEYKALKDLLNRTIHTNIKSKNVTTASVYFRDLNNGRWIGINEEESYGPASLMKVAIMVAYYKLVEAGEISLQQTYIYQPAPQIAYETPSVLEEGKPYNIAELIMYLITKSDNGAKDMLLAHIPISTLNSVYSNLGIEQPSPGEEYKISAKNYALFLRILYNATYLNRQSSEEALELLSHSEFKDGLAAGVPSTVLVAHKFGEKVNDDGQGHVVEQEFHDCGIVYAPTGDYLLCVMTKGQEKEKLVGLIREISSQVYNDSLKKPTKIR